MKFLFGLVDVHVVSRVRRLVHIAGTVALRDGAIHTVSPVPRVATDGAELAKQQTGQSAIGSSLMDQSRAAMERWTSFRSLGHVA
jgi:hypothetical protein